MATKMKRLSLHLRTFLLVIWSYADAGDGYSCPYGQTCRFEPAPHGRTPPCAQPGLTYCVHPEPYPEQLIRHLVEAGQYDIRTLLSDESREDFNAKKDYPYGYGPNSIPNVDQISLVNDYNTKFDNMYNPELFAHKTPLQPPSPIDPSPYNVKAYQPSNFSKFGFDHLGNSWTTPNQFGYDKRVFRQNSVSANVGHYNPNYFNTPVYNFDMNEWYRQGSAAVTEYNPNEWWKYISPSRADVTIERSVTFPTRTSTTIGKRRRRNAELVEAARKRKLNGAEALRLALGFASDAEDSAERPRRQTSSEELCPANTRFITPRAALNNKGNWMYIVNMPDNMTQLVRVEVCSSSGSECNGLCSVPLGYRSRCEQKYIQKRLVALEGNGQRLYTDLFWIPSCCQCTISNNS